MAIHRFDKTQDDKPLGDLDGMPFGKYRGTPMQDVPVEYLHWFWHNGDFSSRDGNRVASYISKSLDALREENEDLIWSKR